MMFYPIPCKNTVKIMHFDRAYSRSEAPWDGLFPRGSGYFLPFRQNAARYSYSSTGSPVEAICSQ